MKKTSMFERNIAKLTALETKINRAYYSSRDTENFFEGKRASKWIEKWNELIVSVRGWAEYRYDDDMNDLTNPEWTEYCNKSSVNPCYTIGDICA